MPGDTRSSSPFVWHSFWTRSLMQLCSPRCPRWLIHLGSQRARPPGSWAHFSWQVPLFFLWCVPSRLLTISRDICWHGLVLRIEWEDLWRLQFQYGFGNYRLNLEIVDFSIRVRIFSGSCVFGSHISWYWILRKQDYFDRPQGADWHRLVSNRLSSPMVIRWAYLLPSRLIDDSIGIVITCQYHHRILWTGSCYWGLRRMRRYWG